MLPPGEPEPPDAAIVIEPAPLVIVTFEPAVNVVLVKPVPLPMSSAPFAGVVVRPVPPLATPSVPANVIVPELVIGPPLVVRPVDPPDTPTDETVPELAAGVAHVPSPRQKVVLDADVPLLRLVTGRLPVTPVVNGRPVALVSTPLAGVPSAGVIIVGLVNVRPATVAAVPPRDTAVDPIVTDELVKSAFGIVVDAVTALAPLAYI